MDLFLLVPKILLLTVDFVYFFMYVHRALPHVVLLSSASMRDQLIHDRAVQRDCFNPNARLPGDEIGSLIRYIIRAEGNTDNGERAPATFRQRSVRIAASRAIRFTACYNNIYILLLIYIYIYTHIYIHVYR